jgi:cytochrome c oxidase assembly factor 2
MPGAEPGTQRTRRRRRRKEGDEGPPKEGGSSPQDRSPLPLPEAEVGKRECPVPKPSGLVGQLLGFEKKEGERLPAVKVEKFVGRIRKDLGKGNNT